MRKVFDSYQGIGFNNAVEIERMSAWAIGRQLL